MTRSRYFVGVAFILLCAVVYLTGCNRWEPELWCPGRLVPEVGAAEMSVVNGEVSESRLSTFLLWMGGNAGCSAVALDAHTIITAAHCVAGNLDRPFAVSVDYVGEQYALVDPYVYPFYEVGNDNSDFDVAVFRSEEALPGPFPFDIYDPAAGGYGPDLRDYCTGFEAQGFGRTKDTNERGLWSLPFEIGGVTRGKWGEPWTYIRTAPLYNDDERGLCLGDSGGPLYAHIYHPEWGERYYLVGIAVGIYDVDECTGGGWHAYLDLYSTWIYDVRRCQAGKEPLGRLFWADTCEEMKL